jgi:hypothetical protein
MKIAAPLLRRSIDQPVLEPCPAVVPHCYYIFSRLNQAIDCAKRLRQTLAPVDHCLKIALVLLIPGSDP